MTTPAMEGMPPEPEPTPKIYVSGTPTPEANAIKSTLEVDDNVIITAYAKVRQTGVQHEKQGAGPFVKLNAYELIDIRQIS